ncbi:MAG TPA: phage tail tube protein [Azospirillaceae bacterium]|nr:phage tail tube protein [Azospirillaceae bacterium]
MAQKFWRKKVLLAKTETTYGTDATPTGAANAILCTNVSLTPLEAQEVGRELDTPYLGAQPDILVGRHSSLSFEVELAGSGTAGTAPAWGPLMIACGFAETVMAASKVDYDPVSSGFGSVTLVLNIDGTQHRLLGARGNVQLRAGAGQIPKLAFSFRGLFTTPTATALPTPNFGAFKDPVPVTDGNTPNFSLNGVSLVMSEFEIDMGNEVQGRFLVNQEMIALTDRRPSGRCNVEMPDLAAFNPYTLAGPPAQLVALAMTHGTTAGGIVELAAPKVQVGKPGLSQSQGVTHYALPLKLVPDQGNDELRITVK